MKRTAGGIRIRFRQTVRRGRCPRSEASTLGVHRPAHRAAVSFRASDRCHCRCPPHLFVLSFRASDRCHWRGNPFPAPAGAESPPASLCEGGVTAFGRDGGIVTRAGYPKGTCSASLHSAEPRPYARLPRAYALNVSGGCGHPPLHPVSHPRPRTSTR